MAVENKVKPKRAKKSIYRELSKHVKQKVVKREKEQTLDIQSAIRRMRETRNLSGVQFCRLAGDMDPKTLTALEKGRIRNPSIKTLESCARALGVTISAIFREAEVRHEEHYIVGTQKGAFLLDFAKWGVKMVSFTPLIRDFFCGKMTLGSKVRLKEDLLECDFPLYISCLVGKVEITVEGEKTILREGQNIFFNGVLKHSIYNPLYKEASMLIMMAPSFLR